jgi:hypothetical protein
VAPHLVADSALFVIALADDEPEKRAALDHARECPDCEALLEEARALLQMFEQECAQEDHALQSAALDPGFEARVHATVYAPARAAQRSRFSQWCLLLGALLSGLMVAFQARAGAMQVGLGTRCFFYEQAFALGSLALGMLSARKYLSTISPYQSALMAMTGALVGQAILQVRCEADGAVLHLLLFHALGVAVATALGGFAGRVASRAS